jgi:hypothetical protein
VVDSTTGRQSEVPILLLVQQGDHVEESLPPYDPAQSWRSVRVGLGREVQTVGRHTIEIQAQGIDTVCLNKVFSVSKRGSTHYPVSSGSCLTGPLSPLLS